MNVGIDVTGLFWIYKTGFENLYYALFQELEKLDAQLDASLHFVLIDRATETAHACPAQRRDIFEYRQGAPLAYVPTIHPAPTRSFATLPARAWNRGVRSLRRGLSARTDRVAPLYRNLDVLHVWYSDIYRAQNVFHAITFPDLIPLLFPEWCDSALVRAANAALEFARDEANVTIAISENTKNDLVNFGKVAPERITVIYPGVREIFQPLRERTGLAQMLARYNIPQKPYLLSTGYLNPHKNLRGHLRAFELLAEQSAFYDVQMVFVGPQGMHVNELLADISSSRVRARVHVAGYIPDADLVSLMGGAEAYLHCSYYEGFGLTALEAMACGVPVVTSNTSALAEITAGAALQVNPNDVNAIADAIARVLEDDALRQDLIARGLTHAAKFTWRNWALGHVRVYTQLAHAGLSQETRD